jgi:hypothetical protein
MSDYGYLHTARVINQDAASGGWFVQSVALARDRKWGPIPSCVAGLAPGDKVVLAATGTTRDNLLILGAFDPRYPDIGDIPGLQAALDLKADQSALDAFEVATEADLAALVAANGVQDGRLTTVEGRATSLEGRATLLEGRATTLESRATAIEGVNTTQNTRLTTAEGNITALQARKSIRIPRPQANSPLWLSTLTTGANTTYVIAQANIADPGWPYFIEGMANFTVSGVTGGPYSSAVHMRVDAATNPSGPGTDLLGSNFMRTIDGGFATFQVDGVSQQSWTGARTVYLILRNGATGVMTVGNLSTSLMYRFDLIIHPA